MKANKAYGDFIGQLPWNIFATLRYPYKINQSLTNKWFTRLMTTSNKVISVFYSIEKDKGDPKSKHVHTLINSTSDISYDEFRAGLGNIAVGDYQLINDPKDVEIMLPSILVSMMLIMTCCSKRIGLSNS